MNSSENNTPAVGYARVSGEAQTTGDGFVRQATSIHTYAHGHGYAVHRIYEDGGISGKTGAEDRPGFQQMIAELLDNGCRTIIVESLDRLARQYDIQQQLATYIASKGIALISANTGENITEALNGDPMRRALIQIQGIFAELDKNMIVAKLAKARERKRMSGERCEGVKPYGTLAGEERTYHRMMEAYGAGVSTERIARQFNTEDIPSRSGKPWRGSTIRKILAREAQ